MTNLIPYELIVSKIFLIRGVRVMIDRDLAQLYRVSTKVLNQAVKRNVGRFPEDFMFRLTKMEKEKVVTICDHLNMLKFSSQLPYVFTKQGVAMLSSVLNSERAIELNIQIMRAFVQIRHFVLSNKDLAKRVGLLEAVTGEHSKQIKNIFDVMRQLSEPPPEEQKEKIGFKVIKK